MSENVEKQRTKDEYWREEVERIKDDWIHGSMFLADETLKIIERFIEKQLYQNRTELFQSFSKLVNALVRAKPLMAMIYNRSHRILDFIESFPKDERDIRKVKKEVLNEIQNIRSEATANEKAIIKFGARLIMEQHTVLTHSASHYVELIFRQAKRMKKHFRVVCTESRPRLEGTQLAARLAKAGIKTRLISDADISRTVGQANFVLTGVDRITETSVINKTGTRAAAIVAKELDTPLYIVTDTTKILPKRRYPAKFGSARPEDIFSGKKANLSVENYIFEEIPLTFISKIICETGIYETEEFIKRYLAF